jgi:hypothetical protein
VKPCSEPRKSLPAGHRHHGLGLKGDSGLGVFWVMMMSGGCDTPSLLLIMFHAEKSLSYVKQRILVTIRKTSLRICCGRCTLQGCLSTLPALLYGHEAPSLAMGLLRAAVATTHAQIVASFSLQDSWDMDNRWSYQ